MRSFSVFFYQYGLFLIYLLIAIILIRLFLKASIKDYHSNWYTFIDKFSYSSQEFYKQLIYEVQSNGIKNISTKFVFLKEGNAFSSKRTYLRITWKDYDYDICAAPFGNGFFVSWWLMFKNSFWKILIYKTPLIGNWLALKLFPTTYYKLDTASMFMGYVQTSVLKIIDNISNEQGLKVLSENERKPILKDIFKR